MNGESRSCVSGNAAARSAPASLYSRLVTLKQRLPQWLLYRLDPYNTTADRFVAEAARTVADGAVVLDAGAGECRHAPLFRHAVYLGTDSGVGDATHWDYSRLAFVSDLTELPLSTASIDAAVSVNVLEHVVDPQRVLAEIGRVLRPGAPIYLVAPQSWPAHQAPHDYQRFTRHGLEAMLERAGFKLESIRPIGGAFWNAGLRSLYVLASLDGAKLPLAVLLAPILGFIVPIVCFYLDRLDGRRDDTLGHAVVARKSRETDSLA